MLPRDTITYTIQINGNSSTTVAVPPFTVLGYYIQQENLASNTNINIGSNTIAKNYAKNTEYVELNAGSKTENLYIIKTGQDTAYVTINYVPRYRSELADPVLEYQMVSTTNGQIDGTILTNYFLLIIMCGLIFGFILKKILKNK